LVKTVLKVPWVMNIILTCASLIISGTIMELTVRNLGFAKHMITDPAFESSSSPGVIYRYKANFAGLLQGPTEVRTNSFGCRDREYSLKKEPGVTRIVVLGDSITFGQGVKEEETFPKVMEKSLNKTLYPSHIEIINFGVQGYTIKNEVARYLTEARQFKPDVAILASISEDLNMTRELNFVDEQGFLTKKGIADSRLKRLMRRFHTAYLIKEIYYKKILIHTRLYRSQALTSDNIDERLTLLQKEVRKFVAACEKDRAIPIFALLDLEPSVFSNTILVTLRRLFPDLLIVDIPSFMAGKGGDKLRIPRDGHPNKEAHEIISDVLIDQLRRVQIFRSTSNRPPEQ